MADFPFVSYETLGGDLVGPPDPSFNVSFLYPQFRGEKCANFRPDPTPRGENIAFAGQTFQVGGRIYQGVPQTMSVTGGAAGPNKPGGFGTSVDTSAGPNLAGTGANGTEGRPGTTVWTNPSNVTSTSSFATVNLAMGANNGNGGSAYIHASNFLFSFQTPNLPIVGVNVIGNAFTDATADFVGLQIQLLKNGNLVGQPKLIPIGSSSAPFSVGGNGDTWGVPGVLVASDVSLSTFGVAIAAVYQGSHSSGTHQWSPGNINLTLYTADLGLAPYQSASTYSGTFSLPLSQGGGIPIASYVVNGTGILQSNTDIRASGLSAFPIISGFQEQSTDDITKLRTLDNSFHVRCDHTGVVGRVYVGAGVMKLPNSTIVTWSGVQPTGFWIGPFVTNGVIRGKSAVTGRPGLADAVAGICQVYMDNKGGNHVQRWPSLSLTCDYFPIKRVPSGCSLCRLSSKNLRCNRCTPCYVRRIMANTVLNEARRQYEKAIIDLREIGNATNQQPYVDRRYREAINSSAGSLEELKSALAQLRNDFMYLATATGNAAAVRRRDQLQQLLDTL